MTPPLTSPVPSVMSSSYRPLRDDMICRSLAQPAAAYNGSHYCEKQYGTVQHSEVKQMIKRGEKTLI